MAASSEFEAGELEVQIARVASRYHKVAQYILETLFRRRRKKQLRNTV